MLNHIFYLTHVLFIICQDLFILKNIHYIINQRITYMGVCYVCLLKDILFMNNSDQGFQSVANNKEENQSSSPTDQVNPNRGCNNFQISFFHLQSIENIMEYYLYR